MLFYAHTSKFSDGKTTNPDTSTWEPLFTPFGTGDGGCQRDNCGKCERMEPQHGHLNKVAYHTATFASEMFPLDSPESKSARDWGYLTGLWHDLGKFSHDFQTYLSTASDAHSCEIRGKIDHTTAGAQLAISRHRAFGHIIANAIAGHHSGLLDSRSTGASLEKRFLKEVSQITDAPPELLLESIPTPPAFLASKDNAFALSFFQRMLFSCLVDADFLATESFMNPAQAALRPESPKDVFKKALSLLEAKITGFGIPETPVAKARATVFINCLEKATESPGLFTLTVPTGGGKTLSSLAFALRHAITHGQRRIIYVIPFTSIIEQNAAVFADLLVTLGPNIVLEHHSNLSPENEEKESTRSRLATENWDAPIVVTTAVQFYESCFANKTSRSRKLHNIANSVLILDEAQTLPVQYLAPCLRTLEQFAKNYHATIVLCTATQPAIAKSSLLPIGLETPTEIISDTKTLFENLDRVQIAYRNTLDDQTIASEITAKSQALCIVNTRKHARTVFQLLPKGEGNIHLSTLMFPAHRLRKLKEARQRLTAGLPVRLISTQLIEAGVDIDFPIVYRSMAGLDSIAQAAGRCNRNGTIPTGHFHVFHSEHIASERFFRETAQVGHEILDLHSDSPLSTAAVQAYFDKYYYQQKSQWDSKSIMADFLCVNDPNIPLLFQYKTAAEKFRLIENNQIPIFIPNDEISKELTKQLRNKTIPLHRNLLRSLQRYTVQIYDNEFFKNQHQFESVRAGQFHILICPETHYSEDFGLDLSGEHPNSHPLICNE
jgi:CRISPR-associated endonuclease/helicase Cas3